MEERIKEMIKESINVFSNVSEENSNEIRNSVDMILECLKNGNKIILAGNGGSATQASHIGAEFSGRYKLERRGLPAVALTTDLAAVTAIGNDYGFEHIFERQLEALGKTNDVLIVLSTSGNSKNINNAIRKAKEMGIKIISLIGKDGGEQKGNSNIEMIVPSKNVPKIQEAHLAILHIICEIVEEKMFGE